MRAPVSAIRRKNSTVWWTASRARDKLIPRHVGRRSPSFASNGNLTASAGSFLRTCLIACADDADCGEDLLEPVSIGVAGQHRRDAALADVVPVAVIVEQALDFPARLAFIGDGRDDPTKAL